MLVQLLYLDDGKYDMMTTVAGAFLLRYTKVLLNSKSVNQSLQNDWWLKLHENNIIC